MAAKSAEALKFEAEAAYFQAEARKSTAEAMRQELNYEEAARKRAKELAGDEHHHVYRFDESVSSSSTRKCMEQLAVWTRNDPGCAIEIVFHSPGGNVIDGLALWDFIKSVQAQGHHVTTRTIGMAASMAGVLLQAGDVRSMGATAHVLIHEVSFGVGGKLAEVEDEVAFAKKLQERILSILSERSRLTKAQIKRRWKRTDWWLDSSECLELGLVDEVR